MVGGVWHTPARSAYTAEIASDLASWRCDTGSTEPLLWIPLVNSTRPSSAGGAGSLDHLIRPLEQRRRDREPERLGGLEVDYQLEFGGLLDR